jgi:carboxyl-terminal processing protease
LRGNSGGLLEQAISVAGALLENGTVVVVLRERNSTGRKTASGGDLAGGKPVVVLIDQNTASGAEIVASSLQHEHRAAVVGSKSFGAGTVQTVIPLDSRHEIKFTTAKMFRADGASWEGKGVVPDVIVPAPAGPTAKEQADPVLAAALDVLWRKQ